MKLIIGLGNPGEEYQKTRHNIGFTTLDRFLKDFERVKDTTWEDNAKFKSDILDTIWQPKNKKEERIILIKPKTYMNNSGMAVGLVANFYKITSEDIWIIHDDVDLLLGSLRIRLGGASAGHHGVESIISSLNTDKFWRFRMGVGRPKEKASSKGVGGHVLGKFSHLDSNKIRELIKRTSKALQEALENSMESAMNKYNSK